MKKISDKESISNYKKQFELLTTGFLPRLKEDYCKNQKKIIEICHLSKFLMLIKDFQIEEIREVPDFIIRNEENRFGLEHQILTDSKSKEREGFINNLFRLVEIKLKEKEEVKPFLANIYIKDNFGIELKRKRELINKLYNLINKFLKEGELDENEVIEEMFIMNHSQICLCPNLGAWTQKAINKNLIIKGINKKDEKINKYIENTKLDQWLLLVAGGVGESSYTIEKEFDIRTESKFKKIFLLEDFYDNLYEIK